MKMEPIVMHGGDRVGAALAAHGVRFVFTLCGGHISPILTASKARGIRIIDVRDEATAVFAADAVARLTGVPGVAAVTAGPGLTNAITALKNAQLAQSPVILLGGAAPTALQGRGALQDIDQRPLIEPHVKRFMKIRRVRDLGPAVEAAFAVARAGVPGPVCIECPVDLLYDEASIRQWYADAAGKGTAIADRLLRFYLHRHVEKMFAGSAESGRRRRCAKSRLRSRPPPAWKQRPPPSQPLSGRCLSSAARRCRLRPRRHALPQRWRSSAFPCTCRAWRAACSGAITRCRCAISAARRCANPTACCSRACPATSVSTTAVTYAAAPR
ncbi:acetolactate synthase-like protein [mine drainage metagenome]|uniref:Acetolactate synthase-like protein n=1 Tax=mine drainage metagenome TaxID=410659 RepID=T0ZGT1_9ZZZZ